MRYLALCICTVIALASCTKNAAPAASPNAKLLPGVWELRDIVGGMVIYDAEKLRPGNGTKWAFSKSAYLRLFKDTVYAKGFYTISSGTGTDLNTGRTVDQLLLNNQPTETFELKNDTLRFYYGAMSYDGYIAVYAKITDDTSAVKIY